MPLEIGALLNHRYRIEKILAEGGMGAIYSALDESLHIQVAVKENFFQTDEAARQFHREAKILASLRHPNLPRVTDHFSIQGQGQYLVMDYVPGQDLREILAEKTTLGIEEIVWVGAAVCDALSYLHLFNPPIIHRDIKPGNIKLSTDGQVFLVDFGLAKQSRPDQTTTLGAQSLTPGFAPPEQYGQRTDPRSDIYSLGATLYAALTGIIPEDGFARSLGTENLTPIRKLVPQVPGKLAEAIEKAMSISPENRFQRAADFKAALLSSLPAGSIPTHTKIRPAESGLTERKGLPGKHRAIFPYLLMLALFVSITLVVGRYFLLNRKGDAPTEPPFSPATSAARSPTASSPSLPPPTEIATSAVEVTSQKPSSAVVAVSAITDSPQPAAQPTRLGGEPGQIAFASNRSGSMQIWLMDVDGSHAAQLTNLPGGACQPAWSPTGDLLAITSPCSQDQAVYKGSGLFVIHADGSGLTPLSMVPGGDFEPAWSPDGKHLAFTSIRDGILHIYIYNLAEHKEKVLSSPSSSDRRPAWSPDGSQIAFETTRLGVPQIWIMEADGSSPREFSSIESGAASSPDWSHQANLILYTVGSSTPQLTARQIENRTAPAVLLSDMTPARTPRISFDDRWVIFTSNTHNNPADIYRISILGTDLTRLTDAPADDIHPAWRPATAP